MSRTTDYVLEHGIDLTDPREDYQRELSNDKGYEEWMSLTSDIMDDPNYEEWLEKTFYDVFDEGDNE